MPVYAVIDDTYFDSLSIQTDNSLEMSLAKQYSDDGLVSIKQKDRSFSRAEKKNSNHSIYVKGFSITRGSNIFSIRSDSYILAGNILLTPITFNLGLVKLIHY